MPAPFTTRSVNVATPLTALTVVVPASVPPAPFSVAVTAFVAPDTTPPLTFRTSTTGCGLNGEPVCAPPGCVVMPSCVGGCAVIPMETDVAGVSEPDVKVMV